MAGAWEVRRFAVLTDIVFYTPDTPLITDISFPERQVQRVRVRVPPGPNGLLGFALTMGGEPVIPFAAGTWFVASDEIMDLGVEDLPTTGAWQITSYNLGIYPHTIYLDFTVSLPDIGAGISTTQPIAPSLLAPINQPIINLTN